MHGAREYGIGEDVGKEFYHGQGQHTPLIIIQKFGMPRQ